MPSIDWLKKGCKNRKFYEFVESTSTEYVDWEVVALFYTAVSWVDFHLQNKFNEKPNDHQDRFDLIRTKIRNIYADYRCLYDESTKARYNPDVFNLTRNQVKNQLIPRLVKIRTELNISDKFNNPICKSTDNTAIRKIVKDADMTYLEEMDIREKQINGKDGKNYMLKKEDGKINLYEV